MIQTQLDKTQPYGENIGFNQSEGKYTQNGIEFNAKGIRVTPITKEERAAEALRSGGEKKITESDDARKAALDMASESIKQKEIPEEISIPANMPDFSEFSKANLINFAKRNFPLMKINMRDPRDTMIKKLEAQYIEG